VIVTEQKKTARYLGKKQEKTNKKYLRR